MYIRKQIQTSIDSLNIHCKNGKITKELRDKLIKKLIKFNDDYKGYSRYNFNLFYTFWWNTNIGNILYPPKQIDTE